MNKKINFEELDNVNGGLKYQESTDNNCPHCGQSVTIDKSKIRKETEGCTDYYYYTCPLCSKEFKVEKPD